MKKRLGLSLITAITATAMFLLADTAFSTEFDTTARRPKMQVEKPIVNAGTLVEGTFIHHTFVIRNLGDVPLEISNVRADCGCTKVRYDRIIAPMMLTRLRVSVDTSGLEGTQEKHIKIITNDSAVPQMTLLIRANVIKAVSVVPDRIFFNGMPGKALDQTVTICAPNNKAFTLKLKQSQLPDDVGVAIEKKGSKWLVHLHHKGNYTGVSRGRIFFTTDIPHRPLITLPVYSRIQNTLTVIPRKIDFSKIRKAHYPSDKTPGPVKTVNLKTQSEKPPEIKHLTISPEELFTIRTTFINGIIRIELSPKIQKFKKGVFETCLKIELAFPEAKQITVPVRLDIK